MNFDESKTSLRRNFDESTTKLRRTIFDVADTIRFCTSVLTGQHFWLTDPHGKLKRTNGTVVMDLCTCSRKTLIHVRCLKMSRDVPNFRICPQSPLTIGMNSHTILQSAKKARQRIGSAYSYSCISKIYLTLNMGFRYQK